MKHPDLLILGYSEAAMFIQQPDARDVSAIIAIAGQREHNIETQCVERKLILNFDDTEVPAPDDLLGQARLAMRQRAVGEYGLRMKPPVRKDVDAIISFAREIQLLGGTLLCHCHAGISRSPAVALICLTTWRGLGSEADCVADIRRARPAAVPHAGLLHLADEALRRGGALLRAAALTY